LDRCFVGDTLTLNKGCLQSGFLHRTGDRLAATMHDDWIDLDSFQENDVARHAIANCGIRRVHKTAAVLHDKRLAAELLDIRQCFHQRRGFGYQVLHEIQAKVFWLK
jgi:hypothetical protein